MAAAVGAIVGSYGSDVSKFEHWLGRSIETVHTYTGDRDWADMNPGWAMAQFNGHMVNFSIPLFPQNSSLAAVANGEGHDKFVEYAKTILANADQVDAHDGSLYVRTGWEMGGEWFAWGQQGNDRPDLFIKAFQNFASAFHEVSDKFKIVWDISGDRGDITKFYPGDKYVDVVSQDFYWNPQWTSYDAGKAFDILRDKPYGLQWLENFADAHGKQTAYTEWGVIGGQDGTEFIKKAAAWFNDPNHNVAYHNYWDSDYLYPGKLSDGSDWASGQAYRDAFGYA